VSDKNARRLHLPFAAEAPNNMERHRLRERVVGRADGSGALAEMTNLAASVDVAADLRESANVPRRDEEGVLRREDERPENEGLLLGSAKVHGSTSERVSGDASRTGWPREASTDLGLLFGLGRRLLAEAERLLPKVLARLEKPHSEHAMASVRGRVDREARCETAREHDSLVQPEDEIRQAGPAEDVRQVEAVCRAVAKGCDEGRGSQGGRVPLAISTRL